MAAKFQVVNFKDLSGVAKVSGRPYVMRIVSGLFTNEDGQVEIGEVAFMQGENRPLPTVAAGQSYIPVVAASSRQGKLQFEITELKPIPVKAAA